MLLSVFSESGYFMKFDIQIENLFNYQNLLVNPLLNSQN